MRGHRLRPPTGTARRLVRYVYKLIYTFQIIYFSVAYKKKVLALFISVISCRHFKNIKLAIIKIE